MRTTNHPLEPEELMAYLDGELRPDRASRAAEHLGSCRECQEIAADLRGVTDRMLEWRVETPAVEIQAMVAPEGKVQVTELPWYRSRLVWGLATACGLAIVALVSVSTRPESLVEFAQLERSSAPTRSQRMQPVAVKATPVPRRTSPEAQPPLIAHTGRLSLVANNFDRARDALQEILTRHHGYIAELTINAEESSARSLDATVKTPANQLDATMAEIKALGRVLSESRGGEEVTEQSIDLDARLVNARNTEERLTDLLKHRTDKLADILSVENQISETRGQIEQMEAERKNLNNRIEYAKFDVHITEEYKAQIDGAHPSTATRLRNAAVEGYEIVAGNLLAVLTGVLSYGPAVLVWCAILFLPARYAWRRFRRS